MNQVEGHVKGAIARTLLNSFVPSITIGVGDTNNVVVIKKEDLVGQNGWFRNSLQPEEWSKEYDGRW